MEKVLLYSYRMRVDTGFAPNPYFGILTLATCMHGIRNNGRISRELKKGNEVWIAGWTGKNISSTLHLIWLGNVCEQIPISEYWKQYPQKRHIHDRRISLKSDCPQCGSKDETTETKKGCNGSLPTKVEPSYFGDNIYCPTTDNPSGFVQMDNPFHFEWNKENDLKGKNVLICEEFYYFGHEEKSLLIPNNILPCIPPNETNRGSLTPQDRAYTFINYVKTQPCLISHLNPIPKK